MTPTEIRSTPIDHTNTMRVLAREFVALFSEFVQSYTQRQVQQAPLFVRNYAPASGSDARTATSPSRVVEPLDTVVFRTPRTLD